MAPAIQSTIVWPLVLYFGGVVTLITAMLGLSSVLGQRHSEPATDVPYESGVVALGSSRLRLSAKFYLIALFFVIFDLEATFIFAWAIAVYDVGWPGFFEMLTFITILMVALVYLWRLGALDWNTRAERGGDPHAVVVE